MYRIRYGQQYGSADPAGDAYGWKGGESSKRAYTKSAAKQIVERMRRNLARDAARYGYSHDPRSISIWPAFIYDRNVDLYDYPRRRRSRARHSR